MINTKYKLEVAELMRAVDRHNASGHFMYVTSDTGSRAMWATLATPALGPTYETCQLNFFYFKTGGRIRVRIQVREMFAD